MSHDDDYSELCQRLLDTDPSVTEVNISKVDSVLLDALTNNSTVTTVSLQNCSLGDEAAAALASMTALTKIRLKKVGLTAVGARRLANSLGQLQLLDLQDNPKLGPRGIQPLADKFSSAVLQELNLSNCRMGHFGAKALGSSGLPVTLEVLNLNQNGIGNDGAWKLAPALNGLSSLVSLSLTKNQIGDDGASEIGRQLPTLLEVLDLSDNDVADVGVEAIAAAVANSQVTKLLLANNKIGNAGAIALGQAETLSGCLEEIDLSKNEIGDEGATALAEGLGGRKNSTLTKLSLKDNRIGDAGAGAFVEHLDHNQTLTNLVLSGNDDISSARLRILDMLLKHRTPRRTTESDIGTPPGSPKEKTKETVLSEARQLLQQNDSNTVEISPSYLEICTNDFHTNSVIGYGAFGKLYKGSDSDWKYAIRAVTENDVTEEMLKEIVALRHDGVLLLKAFSRDDGFCYMIYDTSGLNPLSEMISDDERRKKMSWKMRLQVLRDVVSALDYLHNGCRRSKFHGDIKSANVLVAADYRAQVMDCGLSQLILVDTARFDKGDVVFGSRGYRCPRYERGSRKYNPESDVFSLGIVMTELCTGRLQNQVDATTGQPQDFYYDYVVDKKQELTKNTDGLAGEWDTYGIGTLCKIALACMNSEPLQRPGTPTIVKLLGDLSKI